MGEREGERERKGEFNVAYLFFSFLRYGHGDKDWPLLERKVEESEREL